MGSRFLFSWFALWAFTCAGCLARQVAADGRSFRQALLDMYTDQVVDNLVRASEGQPFVQIAYRNLIVTDTQIAKANLSDESDPTFTKNFVVKTGALLTKATGYTNRLVFGGSLETDRQMQFKADPIVGQTDLFDYYLAFARDPELFVVSDCEPTFQVHIKKHVGCKWYFVPCEASGVFLQLCLKTTFMRGPEPPPTIYWETQVADLEPRFGRTGQRVPGNHVITFSSPIPNDDGHATVSLADGRQVRLRVLKMLTLPYKEAPLGSPPQAQIPAPEKETATVFYAHDEAIPLLYANNPVVKSGIAVDLLKERPAKFLAENHPNLGPRPLNPEAQRLADAVANYRKSVLKTP